MWKVTLSAIVIIGVIVSLVWNVINTLLILTR